MTPRARPIGAALFFFYAALASTKAASGEPQALLWLCHTCLLLSALALLTDRPALARAAFLCVALPTLVWWLDAGFLLATGRLLVGAIDPPQTPWQWVTTSHHLYLAPLLLVVLRDEPPTGAEPALACLVIALLIGAAFLATPRDMNINWSTAVLPGVDLPAVHAWNALPPITRLPLTALAGCALIVAPGAVALRAIAAPGADHPTGSPRAATR